MNRTAELLQVIRTSTHRATLHAFDSRRSAADFIATNGFAASDPPPPDYDRFLPRTIQFHESALTVVHNVVHRISAAIRLPTNTWIQSRLAWIHVLGTAFAHLKSHRSQILKDIRRFSRACHPHRLIRVLSANLRDVALARRIGCLNRDLIKTPITLGVDCSTEVTIRNRWRRWLKPVLLPPWAWTSESTVNLVGESNHAWTANTDVTHRYQNQYGTLRLLKSCFRSSGQSVLKPQIHVDHKFARSKPSIPDARRPIRLGNSHSRRLSKEPSLQSKSTSSISSDNADTSTQPSETDVFETDHAWSL